MKSSKKSLGREIALIYVGDGSFLHGVPARDLTIEEIEGMSIEHLMATGLYKEPEPSIEQIPKKRILED